MGWFDDLFSNKQKTQSTSSSQVAEPELQKFRELLSRARDLSYNPYQEYEGQRVANLGADFDAAADAIYGAQDQADPWFNAAYSSAQAGAAPVTWQDVQAAYNPYIDNQVRTLQDDFAYQNDIAQQRAKTTSTNAGVITGDRARVAETLTEDAQRRSQDPQIAAMRTQAGDRAWQGAEGNRDAARAGAQVYGQLGGQIQDSAYKNVEGLMGLAGARQQNQQANLDWNYQNTYANAQAYPYQNMSWYGQFLGMAPGMATQSNGTSTGSTQTGLGNVAAGIGSAALGGWLGSDERIKENIVPIGKAHDGQTIYRYNYVGDPTTQIGFIAQEVEQSHPEAVAEGPDGIKMVNYDLATREAAPDMPHKSQEGAFAYGGAVETRMGPTDFDKLVGKVDTAVRSLRGHMQGGRASYAAGGPALFAAPSASSGYVGASGGYVPEGKGMNVAPLQSAPPPALPADTSGSDMQQWSNLGAGLGKWLGKKSTDPTDPASWKTTVTRNPNYDRGGSVAGFGLSEDDPLNAFAAPPVDYAENFSMSPITMKQSRPSGVPGLSFDGAAPQGKATPAVKSYDAKPTSTMGDAYAPPLQSEAPSLAEAPQSMGVAAGGPETPATKDRAWYEPVEGKEWYEFGSNPELGLALATAASGFFGPGGGPGRALATGIGTYLSRADNERKQQREDREAELRAAQLENESKLRGIQTQEAKAKLANEKLGKIVEVDKKAFLLKPDGTKEVIYDGSGNALGQWDNIKDKTSAEESLRKEFQAVPTVKDFITMRDSYNRVMASSKNPDAAGDIALIYAYMKILDPGSVVRETEFATAENAAGVPDKMRNVFNKLQDGTRLGPEESALRNSFVERARMLYDSQQKQYDRVQGYYGQIAKRQGLDTQNVLVDHSRVGQEQSEEQAVYDKARERIKQGVPPQKVYEMLRANGYDPKVLEQ